MPGFTKRNARHIVFTGTLFLAGVLFLFSPTAAAQERQPVTVSFIPQWIPQSQFAGYFAAYEQGIYRSHGLEVKILRGGPDFPPSELLEKGTAQFGTMFLSTALQKRAQGTKLVNIGQVVHRSSLMLIAKKSRGIHTPQDLNNKKVGLWGAEFQIQPQAFFKNHNLSVTTIPQSTTINLFLRDGVDVASAMWYNEYHLVLNAGIDADEMTTFFFSDDDLNFPEDGIYCLEETYRQNPDLCCRFVRASLAGWRWAFEHQTEALDMVMRYTTEGNVGTNRVHQKWMLERMKDIILLPGSVDPTGMLAEEEYQRVAQGLKKSAFIATVPPYSEFFHTCAAHD
jgi:NitT/TauT family transport system substrate-binding protein